jgi:hypothetical protein
MDQGQRALASIEKTEKLIRSFVPGQGEEEVFEKATHYISDARHFYGKKDYFTSFGASDYAYGLIEALLMVRKRK